MIVACEHDGALFNEELISKHGFNINPDRDLREVSIYDPITGKKTGTKETVFNFVGFVTNNNDDLLVVFPKHFRVEDVDADSLKLFDCIKKYRQKRPDTYIGGEFDYKYESNYPFAAFYNIYEYYQTHGLFFENESYIKLHAGERINWKRTIAKSEKFVNGNQILFFPFYYNKKNQISNFITECMIFAIDYTISKFSLIIGEQETGEVIPEFDFLEESEYVVDMLQQFRQQFFSDKIQLLLESLIDFYSKVNLGGRFYLKHYTFSSIWEDMVEEYLCKYFKEVDSNNRIVFDKQFPSGLVFEKKAFHTNEAKPDQYIDPDHYCATSDSQMIFDAKYYSEINGMDYKQISYMFMLQNKLNSSNQPMFNNTYSALILPSEKRDTKIHFKLASEYGINKSIITEEYLDTRELLLDYLE